MTRKLRNSFDFKEWRVTYVLYLRQFTRVTGPNEKLAKCASFTYLYTSLFHIINLWMDVSFIWSIICKRTRTKIVKSPDLTFICCCCCCCCYYNTALVSSDCLRRMVSQSYYNFYYLAGKLPIILFGSMQWLLFPFWFLY